MTDHSNENSRTSKERPMRSRRAFLIMAMGGVASIGITIPAFAQTGASQVKGATAITQVFGDGARLIAVAIEYDAPINSTALPAPSFEVEGQRPPQYVARRLYDRADPRMDIPTAPMNHRFGGLRPVKQDGAPTTTMGMSGPMRSAIMSFDTSFPRRTPASKRSRTTSVRP